MALPRYRVIVKVACDSCTRAIQQRKPIHVSCRSCTFLKYNNVNNLKKFTGFLHTDHPNWTWFNIYEYKKGEQGMKLASFQKGKNEPVFPAL